MINEYKWTIFSTKINSQAFPAPRINPRFYPYFYVFCWLFMGMVTKNN